MSYLEYVVVFQAIIVGFLVSEFMSGWGNMFKHDTRDHINWIHLLFTITLFLFIVLEWWQDFQWRLNPKLIANPGYFLILLVRPLLAFFVLRVLFEKGVDYNVYFFRKLQTIFGVLLTLWSFELFFYFVRASFNFGYFFEIYHDNANVHFRLINWFFCLVLLLKKDKRLLAIYALTSLGFILVLFYLASSDWYINIKESIGS